MAEDHPNNEQAEANESITGDGWPTDDAADTIESADETIIEEDDEQLLSSAVSIDSQASAEAGESASSEVVAHLDDTSDAAAIDTDEDESSNEQELGSSVDPTHVVTKKAHSVAVELKTLELEVRRILESVDNKRKRKLGGTHRWNELEDDIASWRYSGRHDEQTLSQLRLLIHRRHYLFRELSNLASIRPVLNS